MSERENLFRPVHKGIRAMLYELGRRLGNADFTDVPATNALAVDLKRDLAASTSNCFLCLLQAHSNHEERDFFAPLRTLDRDAVDRMVAEHRAVTHRVFDLARTCDDLLALEGPARRIEVGDRLTLEANDLFAYYLSHLNNEEAMLVPVMWERFSDAELRAMRAAFYNRLPVELYEVWMRWVLPALNPHELGLLLAGLRLDPPPNRFDATLRLARELLSADRFRALETRLAG